jgi:hypothetical protein
VGEWIGARGWVGWPILDIPSGSDTTQGLPFISPSSRNTHDRTHTLTSTFVCAPRPAPVTEQRTVACIEVSTCSLDDRACRRTSPAPPMGTDDGPSFSRSQDLRVISRRLQTRTHKIEMKTNMQTNVPRSQVHLDLDPNPDHNHIRLHLEERFGRSGR